MTDIEILQAELGRVWKKKLEKKYKKTQEKRLELKR